MKLNGATTTRSRQGVQLGVIATLLALLLIAAQPPSAHAVRPLDVGFADDAMYQGTSKDAKKWLNKTVDVNAGIIRVNMYWKDVSPTEPADPRDPADPAYDFSRSDTAIEEAEKRNLDVLLTVLSAPPWAEGPNRPSTEEIRPGAWDPDPVAFGEFGAAVAARYSGSFITDGKALPAVEYFQAWNEPNLNTYIAPQWDGEENVASDIFVNLLNNFYDEVKAINPAAEVVAGGVSPYGDPPGGPNRTRPLRFLRELLCLNEKLKRGECPDGGVAPKFDVIAQHPINREDSPTTHATDDDDVEVADFGDVTKTLRAAEKLGTPATPGKHDVFADEVWWQTNPPDKAEGVALKTHARWVAQSLYLLWKEGASKVIFLQFRDAEVHARRVQPRQLPDRRLHVRGQEEADRRRDPVSLRHRPQGQEAARLGQGARVRQAHDRGQGGRRLQEGHILQGQRGRRLHQEAEPAGETEAPRPDRQGRQSRLEAEGLGGRLSSGQPGRQGKRPPETLLHHSRR